MAGEYQALEQSGLGGSMQSLLATLQNAEGGLMSGDDGVVTDGSGLGRWPTSSGLDLAAITALETYMGDTFLPLLRRAIARSTVPPPAVYYPSASQGY